MVNQPEVRAIEPVPVPAFTLVELLVTITVIGILAALLLTAVSSAKLRAFQMQCLNNVRQLELISLIYSSDSGKHPPYQDPRFPGNGNWMGTLDVPKSINVCPLAPLRPPSPTRGNALGSVDKAWVRWTEGGQTMFAGSYGFNSWLYTPPQGWRNQAFVFNGSANIQQPAKTPVFADANWVDGGPGEKEGPYYNLYEGSPIGTREDNMGRFAVPRHGGVKPASAPRNIVEGSKLPGAINLGLADGHAELAPLPTLWNYSWHRDWQVPAQPPEPFVP